MLNEAIVWVEEINDLVREPLVSGSENGDLEIFVCFYEAVSGEWAHWEACRNVLASCRILNGNLFISLEIMIRLILVLVSPAVDQSLIEVKNKEMAEAWFLKFEVNLFVYRDLVIIILHELVFDPSELLVNYTMRELVVFWKLQGSIDEILDLTFVDRGYGAPTEVTKGLIQTFRAII